jgi:hypothetical protein
MAELRECWSIGPLDFVFTNRYTWMGNRLEGMVLHVFYGSASPYTHRDLMNGETLDDAKKLSADIASERFNEWLADAKKLKGVDPMEGWIF